MKKVKKNRKETFRKVLRYIRRYRVSVCFTILMALVTVASTLYIPILIGDAVDMLIGEGRVNFDGLLRIIIKMAVTIAVTVLSQWFMSNSNNSIAYNVIHDMRMDAFGKIEKLPLKYVDSHAYGDIVSRVIADVDQFSDGLLMGFTQLFTGVITILGTLIFMFAVNVSMTMVVVMITPVSLLAAAFIAKRTYAMFVLQSQTRGEQTAFIEEMVGNQKVVRAFHYEEPSMERFGEINERLRKYSLKAIFFSSTVNPTTRFINSLVYTGVGIVGALSAIQGHITVGQLTCFLNYANQYTKPFNEISGVVTELQNALACAERILDLIEQEGEQADAPDAVRLNAAAGEVGMQDVSFSYSKDRKLIEHFNLHAKKGSHIAVVGPTGCGKTTLINLLMRFYDVDEGRILVDGYDVRSVTRESLRRNIGMVLQETWIKSGTIKENIAMGKPDASDEEIIHAAKLTHAHSFIKRLPKGYDTAVSEENCNLSQGQKQLLCITRVMLVSPPMLILDEATSSIDTRTEMKIQKAFDRLMEGKTTFIVAHRLSTIKKADLILVMKDGKIVEQGSHKELLSKNGFYSTLYNSQFAS